MYRYRCCFVGREHHAAGGAAHAGHRRQDEFLHELAFLRRDVDAVGVAVGGVDQAVVGYVQRQVAPELLRHRPARSVRAVRVVGRDFRQLVPVGAPARA